MKVYVNDMPVHLSPGMTANHALAQAGLLEMREQGKKIYDEWENELGSDGALREGAKIYVK